LYKYIDVNKTSTKLIVFSKRPTEALCSSGVPTTFSCFIYVRNSHYSSIKIRSSAYHRSLVSSKCTCHSTIKLYKYNRCGVIDVNKVKCRTCILHDDRIIYLIIMVSSNKIIAEKRQIIVVHDTYTRCSYPNQ